MEGGRTRSRTRVEELVNGVETPRKERKVPVFLTRDEYNRLLALAGAHPRDFCLLTVFLQTGIRVAELCALRLKQCQGETCRGVAVASRSGEDAASPCYDGRDGGS
jgi:integrase